MARWCSEPTTRQPSRLAWRPCADAWRRSGTGACRTGRGRPARAERIAIDFADAGELAEKAEQALAAFEQPARWKVLRGRGIFRGSGPAPKVAFLYTGQGSQYANMLARLRDVEPVVARTFDEADAVMEPLLGRPLTSYLFADPADPDAVAVAETELRKTEITQPAVLTVDLAITRLLATYGMVPTS